MENNLNKTKNFFDEKRTLKDSKAKSLSNHKIYHKNRFIEQKILTRNKIHANIPVVYTDGILMRRD